MLKLPGTTCDVAVSESVTGVELAPAASGVGFADQVAATPFGSPVTENAISPANSPPVTAVSPTEPEPSTSITEFADAFSDRLGGSVTVSAKVMACVPDASDPAMTTSCIPGSIPASAVTVTVTGSPGSTVDELKPTLRPAGTDALRLTAFCAEPLSVTPIVKLAGSPASAVPPIAEAVIVKSAELDAVPQSFTSSAPFTEPRPVARLYAAPVAVNPLTPGTLLFPEGVG